MSRFRGPGGRLHFPRWTRGCWRGDPTECCAVCYVGHVWSIVTHPGPEDDDGR